MALATTANNALFRFIPHNKPKDTKEVRGTAVIEEERMTLDFTHNERRYRLMGVHAPHVGIYNAYVGNHYGAYWLKYSEQRYHGSWCEYGRWCVFEFVLY